MSEGLVAYKNKNTGEVHVFDGTNADLDNRRNFEQVDLDQVPQSTINAARAARVEREMIERSAGINAARVEVTGAEAAGAARANAEGGQSGGGGEPAGAGVLAAGASPEGYHAGPGVLSREGNARVGYEDLRAIADAEIDNPNPQGILSRPTMAQDNADRADALAAAEANDKLAADGIEADGGEAVRVAAADGNPDKNPEQADRSLDRNDDNATAASGVGTVGTAGKPSNTGGTGAAAKDAAKAQPRKAAAKKAAATAAGDQPSK